MHLSTREDYRGEAHGSDRESRFPLGRDSRLQNELNAYTTFPEYQHALLHSWLKTLTMLGITLVPAFFLLDLLIIPAEARHMLPLFGVLRLVSTALVLGQYLVIRASKPSRFSFLHGYLFTLVLSLVITLMTVELGGFNAPYYAGLILVMIAVNMLLPWHGIHSVINGTVTVGMYLTLNAMWGGTFNPEVLINNLAFLGGTVVIAASINHVKFNLVKREFQARQELRGARDALWSEMGIAKQIQTSLLPPSPKLPGYDIAATMLAADEVGGDYYDVFEVHGRRWVLVGDVSGHGVESGLIMMMMQTTIRTLTRSQPTLTPSAILAAANRVLKDNINRLGTDRYMTVTAIVLEDDRVIFAGKHQDILVLRHDGRLEAVRTPGTWLGILDDIEPFLEDTELSLEPGDTLVLFTDGVTEAQNERGTMLGQAQLMETIRALHGTTPHEVVATLLTGIAEYQAVKDDDITVVALQRCAVPAKEAAPPSGGTTNPREIPDCFPTRQL